MSFDRTCFVIRLQFPGQTLSMKIPFQGFSMPQILKIECELKFLGFFLMCALIELRNVRMGDEKCGQVESVLLLVF